MLFGALSGGGKGAFEREGGGVSEYGNRGCKAESGNTLPYVTEYQHSASCGADYAREHDWDSGNGKGVEAS